ncbi:MAG TPA: septum formation initiator [Lutibacter sp.]|nr:septum formation initiator [Lutibacter sp.]
MSLEPLLNKNYRKVITMQYFRKYILNRYVLILIGFGVWMYFFDDNSVRIHNELNKDIDKLESSIEFYKKEIASDKKIINDQKDPEKLERYARETYQMKKDNETIYIIEYDTIK